VPLATPDNRSRLSPPRLILGTVVLATAILLPHIAASVWHFLLKPPHQIGQIGVSMRLPTIAFAWQRDVVLCPK
jgi:hypothetical protein